MVIEDTGCAAVGELIGVSLTQMVPWKWPVIQGRACSTGVGLTLLITNAQDMQCCDNVNIKECGLH